MAIESGTELLHYRLIEKIGEGGMGVVWKALDTTLNREVAIKILPDLLANDGERLARFGREARLLAALNHPNIAAIYGLHEAQGVHFLAMELVVGEDLSQRIARGPLPVAEAAKIAGMVAEALRAAHTNGVVHRDLKPANIRLNVDGEAKVLDFGLAKAAGADGEGSDSSALASLSPTVTSMGTVAGVILGTAAYMSPEQARGKPVDRRADVWAFGCVLYEMLTGKLVFPGETITDVLAAVVRAEPNWEALPDDLPRGVRKALTFCLVKDPKERLHDIADVSLLMSGAFDDEVEVVEAAAVEQSKRTRWREALAWAVAISAIIAVVALALRPHDSNVAEASTHFSISLDKETPLTFVDEPILAFSPNGRMVAFSALNADGRERTLFLRALDRSEPWELPGTSGATSPFFSPDGSQIGFFAGAKLKRIPVTGGNPIELADTPNPRGAVWLPDNTIVFAPTYAGGLYRIPSTGGTAKLLVEPDAELSERTFRWPALMPDGETLLFTVGSISSPNNYDNATIYAVSIDGTGRKKLVEGANMARFVAPDKLIYSRSGSLYVSRLDPDNLEVIGEPIRVREAVASDPSSGAGYFDISPDGDLLYIEGSITQSNANLVRIDRSGKVTELDLEPQGYSNPRLSPDGTQVAFSISTGPQSLRGDIWTYSLADRSLRRISFGGTGLLPLWHPTEPKIFFADSDDSTFKSKPADGRGEAVTVLDFSTPTLPSSLSPDGESISITRIDDVTSSYIARFENGEERLVAEGSSTPAISPDGRWIAYGSPAAGMSMVYVEPIEGGGKWQVSTDYASYPRWSRDGKKLFFVGISDQRPMMEVDVDLTGETFQYGMPRVLFDDLTLYSTTTAPRLNWDTDGEQFIFVKMIRDDNSLFRIEVVLDWAQQINLTQL